MAALGANVSLVPESVIYGETLEDYSLQCDYNIPSAYRADQVPQLGDAWPDDTAPWGYIVTETGSFHAPRGPDRGAFLTGVKYARVKTPYSTSGDLREMYRKFETGRRGRFMGTRIFYAVDAGAEGLVAASLQEGTPMAATGSWAAALLRRTTVERRWRVGLAKITAIYDTWVEWGEFEVIGKGILEADVTTVRMWNKHKVDDHPVGEAFFDEESDTRRRWAIIKGSNAWPYVKGQLRIKVLLTSSLLNTLSPLVGKVNSGACANILTGAAAYTLWFNELTLRQRQRAEGRLYDTTIYLMYDPAGWDVATEAELQESHVREEKVYREDGEEAGSVWQRSVVWEAVSGVETEDLLGWAEGDFSIINGYMT